MTIIVQADMQCVADFIGNSFVVQRRLFASCLQQIKSYASRHRKAFRRKHFFGIIHHHHHYHHHHQGIIDSTIRDSNLIHSIIHLNNSLHTVHLVCISFTSFITSIIKQLILYLRFASQDYFRNSPLTIS